MDKYELALYYEIFKNEEYKIVLKKIQDSNIIFDVWSHIWFFSLYCFKNNPNIKIHCFEPTKENFKKSKFILKAYEDKIFLNNLFADYEDTERKININTEKNMQSSFYNNQFLCKSDKKETVKTINLMNYIKDNNLNFKNSIDVVKIDIEWYEFELLHNIEENFFKTIKTLIFEYHILFPDFEIKYETLLTKLKWHYKKITIKKSKYDDNIWIIVCGN
jgi:FkbM family methyltransferase